MSDEPTATTTPGPAPSAPHLEVSSVLDISQGVGVYDLLGCLAKGGFSEVWRARERELGRVVALKLSRPESDDASCDHMLRGARVQASVFHPAVVPLHACGRWERRAFVVMPCFDRGTLADEIGQYQKAPVSLVRVVEVALALARGLSALHAVGIVHRNLKPRNVLLGDQQLPLIGGFGLALSAPEVRDQELGVVCGTPHYMSPEQARGEALDARTDLFSYGVLLHELVTGRIPGAMAYDPVDRIHERAQFVLAEPAGKGTRFYPAALTDMIDGLLSTERASRPPLEHVIAVLERLSRDETALEAKKADAMTEAESRTLVRELIELEANFEPPNREAQAADARWFDAHWGTPELTRYHGQYVAVYNGAVVAHGPHPLRVKRAAVEACRVHPQRPLIEFVTDPNL